jgi:predicted dehydrogenase
MYCILTTNHKEHSVKTLKTAVIGLGIGKRHAMVLSGMECIELVAVADLRKDLSVPLGTQLGVRSWQDGMELLEKEKLDFVCVCTPPSSHLTFTRAAAQRGVHVFCEKPMAPTLADCDGMIETCRKAGVKLMVGQKKRFQPAYNFVKEMTGKDFGAIKWAVVRYACGRVPLNWFWKEEDGGGPLHENSVHAFDILRFLMGDVERVYAEGGNLFNPDRAPQIDVASVSIRFKSGAVAAVGCGQAYEWGFAGETSYLACEKAIAEVKGSFDNPEHLRYILRSEPGRVVEVNYGEKDLFRAELAHFAECILNDKQPLVPGEEGRASVAVSIAVKESIRTGRPVKPG